jgi:hypothetical protein
MKVLRKLKNSLLRMLISLESKFQELRMPRSLSLRLRLLAENPIQTSSLGGGIFVDSLKLPENFGEDARSPNAKRKRRSPKMRMRSICSVTTMKRI